MINIYQILNIVISSFFMIYNSILVVAVSVFWNAFIYQFLNPNVLFPAVLENGHLPSLNPIWIPVKSLNSYALITQVEWMFQLI
ncbi:MAG: hypothetical protein ACP5SF_05085 [Thermoplasmata archaeon]